MTRLRAVLFDVDDTLFPTTEFARLARNNAVRAMVQAGLGLPEEEVKAELTEVIAEFSSNYPNHFDKLIQRLRPSALLHRNPALIVAAGVAAYHDTKFQLISPFPDAPPLLADLRGAGLKTGVVTHGLTSKQAEKLVRLGLIPHLDPGAIFISEQIGISKPNPKLWEVALRDLELEPAEVAFVGDSLTHDVAPAKELGMLSVWASRAARQTREETGIDPDLEIADFEDLREALIQQHEIPLPPPGHRARRV